MFTTPGELNIALVLIYVFSIYLIARAVYKAFFTKLKTFDDYQKRAAHNVSYFRSRKRAIKTMEEAMEKLELTKEQKTAVIFQIGVHYHYMRDYKKAVEYFDQVWGEIKKSRNPYEKMLACIIVSNYNVGNKEKAREIYHYLRKKESYDPRFEQLSYLESTIFK